MTDYKYSLIRLLQYVVSISNYLQKTFIKTKKIKINGNEKILIIKTDRIGDASWTINFIRTLKYNYPKISIDVVCNDYNEFVFKKFSENISNIFIIKTEPPFYLIKEIYKIFFLFIKFINILYGNWGLWKLLKKNNYDYILNLTGRDYFLVSKYLGKNIGGGIGLLNFLYNYPIVEHNEIGSSVHVIKKWMNIFDLNNSNFTPKKRPIKNVLLFIGGKSPNKLTSDLYKKIHQIFLQNGCNVSILVDENIKTENFVLTKDKNGLYVGHQKLEEFLIDYDIFVGVDGGVLHYASLFIPTLSFYTSTNVMAAYPFGGELITIDDYGNSVFYVSQDYNHYVISNNVECKGCFQIGCMLKKCGNFIDNEVEIIIKRIIELSLTILK